VTDSGAAGMTGGKNRRTGGSATRKSLSSVQMCRSSKRGAGATLQNGALRQVTPHHHSQHLATIVLDRNHSLVDSKRACFAGGPSSAVKSSKTRACTSGSVAKSAWFHNFRVPPTFHNIPRVVYRLEDVDPTALTATSIVDDGCKRTTSPADEVQFTIEMDHASGTGRERSRRPLQ